jgi:PAS domain-containing protein
MTPCHVWGGPVREVQLFWSRTTLENTPMGELLNYIEHAQFLGYSERSSDHIDILTKVVFKDGFSPDDVSANIGIIELIEVLTAPQSTWAKEWVLQVRFNAAANDLISVHASARSSSVTPESTLDQGGLNYIIRGPPQSVGMVVSALRITLKPDRFSASSVEAHSILANRLVSPQQLRVVKSAWDAGWYQIPRSLKMADLAREINLSRSTVSEHLNRVETELVRLLLDSVGDLSSMENMQETYPLDYMWSNIHPDDFEIVRKKTDEGIANKEKTRVVFRVKRLNSDEYRLVRTTQKPNYDDEGNYISMTGMIEDLEGHRDAAEVMKLSMKLANEQTETDIYHLYGVWSWDIKEDRLDWSDSLCKIMGVDPVFYNGDGKHFYELIAPKFLEPVKLKKNEALQNLESFEMEFEIIRPDNDETRVIRAIGSVVSDDAGAAKSLMGMASDVTTLSAAERIFEHTLMGDQKQLSGAFGAYAVNAVSRTIDLSSEAKRILGN